MKTIILFAVVGLLMACNTSTKTTESENNKELEAASYEIVLNKDVEWTHLNPQRGDLAPKAGTLWGDRKGTEATGFLLKPSDGFSSPPHIHNVSYRGIVISGLIHNDDPNAADMWMPAGSFWTQPKGEVHITSAKGVNTFAYIEIDKGPYLVLPADEHFDSGERPVNVDESNIVWLNAADITWVDQHAHSSINGTKLAFLWGKRESGQLNGSLLKVPAGFSGKILSHGSEFRAIIVQGEALHQTPGSANASKLEAGSYFGSTGDATHTITANDECIIYIRAVENYEIMRAE